jgi:hypothetical protein
MVNVNVNVLEKQLQEIVHKFELDNNIEVNNINVYYGDIIDTDGKEISGTKFLIDVHE